MSMAQIATASGEVNASIIKGFLEGAGIEVKFGMANNIHSGGIGSPTMSQSIFVTEEKVEEAVKLLKNVGLIK